MPNLNRVMLMGNLTRDPEMRYLPTNNTPVAAFGLAINRTWKNAAGEKQEEVTFVDCEAFGKPAEVLNQYVRKGNPLYIEGRLKLDQWQDKDGNKRSKLKVVVENFQFLNAKPHDESTPEPSHGMGSVPRNRSTPHHTPPPPQAGPDDGDIPF